MKKTITATVILMLIFLPVLPVQAARYDFMEPDFYSFEKDSENSPKSQWFEWTDSNTLYHVPLTFLFFIDMNQSKNVEKETNWVLPEHPSDNEVTAYFLGTYALITLATYIFPSDIAETIQVITIMAEGISVSHNVMLGISGGYRF